MANYLLPYTAHVRALQPIRFSLLLVPLLTCTRANWQHRCYARAINERRASPVNRRLDAPQSASQVDRGLGALAQLETLSAVPVGKLARMLDYAVTNSISSQIIKRVLKLIAKVDGRQRTDYSLLLSALGKVALSEKEKITHTMALYNRMLELQRSSSSTGHIFDVAIFSAFIKIFASAGDWTKCEAMLAHMLAEDIEPNVVTYTSLLKYCERIGSWKKAAELLEQMKTKDKLTPDVVFYTSLINVCCTRNDLQQAIKVLGEMRAQGVKPNIYTYSSLVNICERIKDVKTALKLFEEMRNENIAPNVYIFTSLINVCERKGDLGTAMKLFGEMTRVYNIQPNTFTFNSLINVCVEKRDLGKSFEILAMMRQFRIAPTTSTYNSLASICAKTGNMAKGLELLQMMKAAGVAPDNLTFTSLISACRPKADTDSTETERSENENTAAAPAETALSLFDKMKTEFGVKPDSITIATLMNVCLRSQQLPFALRAYNQAKHELSPTLQLDKEIYYELVNLCAKKGQWKRALAIVQDMENAGLTPSVRIFNSFLRNFDPVRDIEDAKEVVRLMRERNVEEDDTFRSLLKRFGILPRHVGQILQHGKSSKSSKTDSARNVPKKKKAANMSG